MGKLELERWHPTANHANECGGRERGWSGRTATSDSERRAFSATALAILYEPAPFPMESSKPKHFKLPTFFSGQDERLRCQSCPEG